MNAPTMFASPWPMNSWLPSIRCPDLRATARALEIASESPITVSASAIGASVRQVGSERSGNDSGGTADGKRADRRTCAMPEQTEHPRE